MDRKSGSASIEEELIRVGWDGNSTHTPGISRAQSQPKQGKKANPMDVAVLGLWAAVTGK